MQAQAQVEVGEGVADLDAEVAPSARQRRLAGGLGPPRREARACRLFLALRTPSFVVLLPSAAPADPDAVQAYAQRLAAAGLPAGEARFDDDAFEEKVALLARARPAVVSFAFGLPPAAAVAELQEAGVAVWVTVTTPAEAAAAAAAGADALVAQGAEAGGHRGGFDGAAPGDLGLLALLQLCEGGGGGRAARGDGRDHDRPRDRGGAGGGRHRGGAGDGLHARAPRPARLRRSARRSRRTGRRR